MRLRKGLEGTRKRFKLRVIQKKEAKEKGRTENKIQIESIYKMEAKKGEGVNKILKLKREQQQQK